MSRLDVNPELVRKYNVPGPRYTSYPPATQFSDQIAWPSLAEKILEGNGPERDLSLYFHIPFCQSLCWYCGCTTVITTQQSQSAAYLAYLEKELTQMAAVIDPRRKVTQVHFGGGTPTFLLPDEIRALGGAIRRRFAVTDDAEAGVEIDPRRATRDHIAALREAGFNRASIGIQDFDPAVQKAVRRIQSREQTAQVVEWLREAGFVSVNVDLIYGLPQQTVTSFTRTLEQTLQLKPDRLAVFNYAHVPWMKPAQKLLESQGLPSAATRIEILKHTIETLTGAGGYEYIGMDHFARAGDELAVAQRRKTLQRNFQGYSTRGGTDILAFGMSSISQVEGAYWQNEKELSRYCAALDAGRQPLARGYFMTEEDKRRRETILRLMCDLSLDYGAMSRRLGVNFEEHFAAELASLAGLKADGLLVETPLGLEVAPVGRLFLRNIAMAFDAYLPQQTERRYSRTI